MDGRPQGRPSLFRCPQREFIRARFAIYATGQSNNNEIPKMRLRVSSRLAIVAIDWLGGNSEDGTRSNRVRVEEDKISKIRFHATSTVVSSQNALIRFRARTLKFNWIARLEVGGAMLGRAENQAIARQYLPGVGTSHTSGNYDLIFVSPLRKDIRAESTGSLTDRMPYFATQPGPGSSSASRRDLFVSVDLLDSLTGAY